MTTLRGHSTRVAIIGGGVSGLMAGWELVQLGYRVEIFEAANRLGGLASSFDFDGFEIERFYHFICKTDETLLHTLGRLGLDSKLNWRRTRTGFFYDGKHYPFSTSLDLLRFTPLSMKDRLRFGISMLKASRRTDWQSLESLGAKDWLIAAVGEEAYSIIWEPLLRVKFHEHHEEISAAWMWHRIHRVSRSRPSPFHAEEFGYLQGGSAALIGKLESELRKGGAKIHLNSPVDKVLERHGTCLGVSLSSEKKVFDAVICALPLTLVPRILPDSQSSLRTSLSQLESIGVVCMVLRLNRRLSGNFWTNVHDERISFNGIIEYTNLNEDPALGNQSIVYIPFYLDSTHPRYSTSNEELFHEYCEAMKVFQPEFDRTWVDSYRVFRAPHAQPICGVGFAQKVPSIDTPMKNFYLIESTQLYPADRIISGNLRLAQDAVARVVDDQEHQVDLPFTLRAADMIPA